MNTFQNLVSVLAISILMSSCASTGVGGGPPAAIVVTKKLDPASVDCKVEVTLHNGMHAAWAGVSYWLIFRDASGRPLGELRGIPHRYTETGYGIRVQPQVPAVKCADIASASVQYFGYYPANGGRQVRLLNSSVTAEVK